MPGTMSALDALFRPFECGPLRLANRVVMAPMTRRKAAEDGVPTPAMADYYRRRAEGGVGLIISEGIAIDDVHAWDTLTVPRIHSVEQVAGWARVIDAVHDAGGCFAPQLWHTGRMAAVPIGPCDEPARTLSSGREIPPVRAMDERDIRQVLSGYREATEAARRLGCDAVEIHGAHGYLLDSFLDPRTNRRDDEWGGTPQRRMRFPLSVAETVREAAGPEMPVIYRFSQWRVDDYEAMKWRHPEELGTWVRALADVGIDILHASTRRAIEPAFLQHGDRTLAGWTRELSGLPTIAVGSVTLRRASDDADDVRPFDVVDPLPAARLLVSGEADLLAIGRMLIANPDWPAQVQAGRWRDMIPYDPAMLDELR